MSQNKYKHFTIFVLMNLNKCDRHGRSEQENALGTHQPRTQREMNEAQKNCRSIYFPSSPECFMYRTWLELIFFLLPSNQFELPTLLSVLLRNADMMAGRYIEKISMMKGEIKKLLSSIKLASQYDSQHDMLICKTPSLPTADLFIRNLLAKVYCYFMIMTTLRHHLHPAVNLF